MKLSPDCMRDVLLALEGLGYGIHADIDLLKANLPDYNEEDISYTCVKLKEANYIKAIVAEYIGCPFPQIVDISDITFDGHQFLADIHEDTNWNKTKSIAKSVGSTSVNAITTIASNVISSVIKAQLGLQ